MQPFPRSRFSRQTSPSPFAAAEFTKRELMVITRRPNEEGGGKRRRVLEPPHFLAVVTAIDHQDTEELSRALDILKGMNIDINEVVYDGFPPLHLACFHGASSCVKLLLERGAGLEVKDTHGTIPLHVACAEGYPEIIQHLLNGAPSPQVVERMVNMADSTEAEETPLHHAAKGHHSEAMRILLATGADPRIRDTLGQTPADLVEEDDGTEAKRILEEFDSNVPRQ